MDYTSKFEGLDCDLAIDNESALLRHKKPTESPFRARIMEERIMGKTKIAPQMFAVMSGALILMGNGFHLGWASPSLPKLLEDTQIPVSLSQSSWIVSLMMVGSMVGPLITVVVADRWGRKTSLLLISVPFSTSCILIAFAQSYWWYYAGRFLCGIGLGAGFMMVPMYVGEIAEDRIRGGFGILLSVMVNLGYLIAYTFGPWVSRPVLAALGALIPMIFVATFVWMPETPHYCIMKDNPDRARKSLEWLRGTKYVDGEIKRVKKNVEFDLKNAGTLKELFTDKGNRKALLIVIGLFSAQQFSGITTILAYTTVIFNEVTSGISSALSVIIVGVVQLVVSILLVFVADRAGRRTLLLLSMFFSTIFLIGEAVYFHLKTTGIDVSGISWLPVTAIVGYLCSFTLGLGTLPMAVISEIFPCNVKAYAITIGIIYLALSATFISQVYPILSNTYGIHVSFYVFASGTALLMIFIFFYLPETRGKSLGEIQDILHGRSESKMKLQGNFSTNCDLSKSLSSLATIDEPKRGTIISN